MSIRIHLSSSETAAAIQHLEKFDEVMDKNNRVALRNTVDAVAGIVLPNVPSRSGRARSKFRANVSTETMSTSQDRSFGKENITGYGTKFLVGRVGWFGKGQPWYINVVEHGAVPHTIEPRKAGVLKIDSGALVTFPHRVEHPGMAARHFMADAQDQAEAIAQRELEAATDRTLTEMVVR